MSTPLRPDAPPTPAVSGAFDPIARLLQLRVLDPPARPGVLATVDRFEVLGLLGQGGMGFVLLARDTVGGGRVALKVLRPEFLHDSRAVHRFLTEARHVQRLEHPHILRVLEIADREQGPYFVMPWMEHGSLARRIRPGKPMPEETVVRLAGQVAEALAFAHDRGIIHRDIKPGNVLLDGDDRAYLADFGLGRSTLVNDSIIDVNRSPCEGTPAYLPPEVAAGKAGDFRCDIYAFGAMLYELLTGELPYEGRSPAELIEQIKAAPPVPIQRRNPAVSARMARIVEKAMARELRDRYASAADVEEDLESDPGGVLQFRDPPSGPVIKPRNRRAWAAVVVTVGVAAIAILPKLRALDRSPEGMAVPFAGSVEANRIDSLHWIEGHFEFWPGTGEDPGDRLRWSVVERDGTIMVNATAATKTDGPRALRGLTSAQLAWVECTAPLRDDENYDIKLELSAVLTSGGTALVCLAEGEPNHWESPCGSNGIEVLKLKPDSTIKVDSTVNLRVELFGQNGIISLGQTIEDDTPRAIRVIRSQRKNSKLRFAATAAASSGTNSATSRLKIEAVSVVRTSTVAPRVFGRVLDRSTFRPIGGAIVRTSQNRATETNSAGEYDLQVNPQSGVEVWVENDSHLPSPRTVARLRVNEHQLIDFQLDAVGMRYGSPISESCFAPSHSGEPEGLAVSGDEMILLFFHDPDDPRIHRKRLGLEAEPEILKIAGGGGLALCEQTLYQVRAHIADATDQDRCHGQLLKLLPSEAGESLLRLQTSASVSLGCDDTRIWYLDRNPNGGGAAVWALQRAALEGDTPNILYVGCASTRDPELMGIACGFNQRGESRMWLSSVQDQVGTFEEPRGIVYEVDPERLLSAESLDAPGVIIRQFNGFWYHLAYDFVNNELWGLDRETNRICRLNIDSATPEP